MDNRVTYQILKTAQVRPQIYGLTFGMLNWGEINRPIETTQDDDTKILGNLLVDNELFYHDIDNFKSYTPNLFVYRLMPSVLTVNFDGATHELENVFGVSHSHLFFDTAVAGTLSVWNETDNGSNLYLKKNDFEEEINIPTFGANQILFAVGKYAGTYGKKISISTCTYLEDFNNKQVFKSTDDVDINPYFTELFMRKPLINEIAFVIMVDDVIVEQEILSLDNNYDNFIELYESDYVIFYLKTSYVKAASTDTKVVKLGKLPVSVQNENLLMGSDGFDTITETDYIAQLELLKDPFFVQFFAMFTYGDNPNILAKCKEIQEYRKDFVFILAAHPALYKGMGYGFDLFGLNSYGGVPNGLDIDVYTYYQTMDNFGSLWVYNYKKINYENNIVYAPVSGDVAGSLIADMIGIKVKQTNDFYFSNNIVAINDLNNREINLLNDSYVNVIKRVATVYFLEGNYVLKERTYDLNYALIKYFIIASFKTFAESLNGENIDNYFRQRIQLFSDDINKALIAYTSNFFIKINIIDDNNETYIDLGFKINDSYENITIQLIQ